MRWSSDGLVEPPRFCELIGIALGLGALGSVASAAIGGSAAESAASTQASAEEQAAQIELQMFNKTQANLAPFLKFGQSVIPQYQAALPGLTSSFTGANLAQTPGYQFTLNQGLQAAQNSYASQGLSRSGAAIKGATNYAEGLAGTTYQQVFANQLAQKAQQANIFQNAIGGGQNAAANLGGFATTTGANVGAATAAAGTAQAAGTVGAANAASAGISGLSNNALLAALIANQTPSNPNNGAYTPTSFFGSGGSGAP